jgi:hypothetical protein
VAIEKLIGLAVGLFLGFVWVIWSFGDMVLVALVGLVGYVIGAVVSGHLDLPAALQRLAARR